MILEPERGTYSPGMMSMQGSFQLNTTNPPTVFRDGTNVASASKMFTVTRVSAGLYQVTFIAGFPLPALPFIAVKVAQGATPTNHAYATEVVGSWDPTTGNRKFRILIRKPTDGSATDGDAGDRVTFFVRGSFIGPGIDPA